MTTMTSVMSATAINATRPKTQSRMLFKSLIGEIQRVAKEAFMKLKGRWRCLQENNSDFELQDLSVVVGACCVLHNICEMRGDGFEPDQWGFELVDEDDEEDEEDEEE
ncbi:hypothetical protein F3Y22_tig00112800pilonHSYRG00083 [Hibiscus syriacus]|uniref:DDE Tnp4 domain-containing protein n=1 Tax=Hibiscus syriacus TaxID=106335 RepID=A0A6A2XQX1_HIBSY|nr:hypothetical protein F3Y22_tig00112800pilonHSYRG00083 [Hibiscus syriacus]